MRAFGMFQPDAMAPDRGDAFLPEAVHHPRCGRLRTPADLLVAAIRAISGIRCT
jgi:hypothetical protein